MHHCREARPSLAPGEVHVWRTLVADFDAASPALLDTLSDDEWARAARLRIADDRRRFIVTRGLLRRVLGGYLNIDAAEVAFAYGPNGKPMLTPAFDTRLQFNVSHAGDIALIAVSYERPVGVDVEQIRPLDDVAALADMVFTPTERAVWQALPGSESLEVFFKLWTRKEALLKGLGAGLSRPAHGLEIGVGGDSVLWRDSTAPHTTWRLADIAPWCGYVACIAVETTGPMPTLYDWDLSQNSCETFLWAHHMIDVAALAGALASFRGGAQ